MRVMLPLTSSSILNKITSYDIFRYYINNFTDIGKFFCSELRQDRNPTCVISNFKGNLIYKDFKYLGYMNCFEYVKEKYGVNYNQALHIINTDFNLDLISIYSEYKHISLKKSVNYDFKLEDYDNIKDTIISIQPRKWNKYDKEYWFNKYGISTKDLQKYKVFPLQSFWINHQYFKADIISYAYYYGNDGNKELYKIYQPYNKFKWITNCSSEILQGYDLLPSIGKQLIITKSYKDVIVLSKLEVSAIAPQSEVCNLNPDVLFNLKSRFDQIYILYDNDQTGKRNAIEIANKYDFLYFFMPEILNVKDASDYVNKKSLLDLKEYFTQHGISCSNP